MLRRRGYGGSLTVLSADGDAPYDRPNLSKDYLAGSAPESWLPMRSPKFYERKDIALHLHTAVSRIDRQARTVVAADGRSFGFDRLLLAPGAEPVRLSVPGAGQPNVFTLRSLADSRAIIEIANTARSAVVVGAGSSVSKSPRPFVRETSMCTWLRPTVSRLKRCWARS